MALRIENTIVNNNPEPPVKAPVQQEQEPVVVPVGQAEEKAPDPEAPVGGYYIEVEAKQPDGDDDEEDKLNTSVDPNARVTINPSIAIHRETDEISNAIKQAVERAVANAFHDSGADDYFKATDMIKTRQPYNCFDDMHFAKNFNIYGKAVYEAVNYSYTTDIPSRIERQENSFKTDLGLNYKSKSDNIKAMFFSSFTKTNAKTDFNLTQSEDSEMPEGKMKSNYKSYSLYGVLQQRFKNNDLGTLSAYHTNDETVESKTSNVTASYFFNKYMALVQGSLNTHDILHQKSIKNFKLNISFNPELAFPELKAKDASEQEVEPKPETKVVQKDNTKKWSKSFSQFIDTQSINGNAEEGIGGEMRFKRTGSSSTCRVGAFGKFSTTQLEENNNYHLTLGSELNYNKNFNTQSQLNASIALKDRITFGKGNITTANATVSYTSSEITAELEGKIIKTTNPDSPDYAGVAARLFYTPRRIFSIPNKNLNFYTEVCGTRLKEWNATTAGSELQLGLIANF